MLLCFFFSWRVTFRATKLKPLGQIRDIDLFYKPLWSSSIDCCAPFKILTLYIQCHLYHKMSKYFNSHIIARTVICSSKLKCEYLSVVRAYFYIETATELEKGLVRSICNQQKFYIFTLWEWKQRTRMEINKNQTDVQF